MSVLLEKHSEELCEQRRLHEESLHQLEAEKVNSALMHKKFAVTPRPNFIELLLAQTFLLSMKFLP